MLLPDRSRVPSHQGAMWCVWGFYDIDSYVTASFFTAYVCTENSSALTKLSLKVLLSFVLFYTFYCHSLLEALKMYPRLRLDTDLKGFVLVSCCLWWQCVASDSLMPCMKVIMGWGGTLCVSWKKTSCSSCCIMIRLSFLIVLNLLSVFWSD